MVTIPRQWPIIPWVRRYYDLTDLHILVRVAAEGNLSRGAELCRLAPSSVSLRIRGLEEAIGTPLLIRKARGVALTAAGQILVEHAKRCFAQLDQMHADLMPYAKGLAGNITLFANNNAMSFLPDDLAEFFKTHGDVRITLEERTSHEIVGAVAAGRADLGIVVKESTHPDLEFVPYRADKLVLLAPVGSSIAGRKAVSFEECLAEPFISLARGAALHTFLMNHSMTLGARLDIRVQVSGYRAIVRLVASGAGIGIVPQSALIPSDSKQLAIIQLSNPWAARNLEICRRKGEKLSRFCEDFIASLRVTRGRPARSRNG